jgi:hypothetical protein
MPSFKPFDTQLIGQPPADDAPRWKVTLLDPGSEPRNELRFRVAPGTVQRFRLQQESKQKMRSEGAQMMPAATPGAILDIELTRKPGSEPVYAINLLSCKATGKLPEPIELFIDVQKKFEGLTGMTFDLRIDEVGVVDSQAMVDAQPDLGIYGEHWAKLEQTLGYPLPIEAVGPGARWKIEPHETPEGSKNERIVTLKSVDGSRIKLTEERDMFAGAQTTGNMTLPNVKQKATGTVEIDLSLPVMLRSEINESTQAKVSMAALSSTGDIEVEVEANYKVSPL